MDSNGRQRVCGSVDLKGSQHYPVLFGRTVAEAAIRHLSLSREECEARRHGAKQTHVTHCPSSRAYLLDNSEPEMKAWSVRGQSGSSAGHRVDENGKSTTSHEGALYLVVA